MSNVVLPRDVVERVRDFMYPHVFDLQGAEWAPARALLAALDAALAAPEPFERLEDGSLRVQAVPEELLVRMYMGSPVLVRRTGDGIDAFRWMPDGAALARAIAIAFLEITEPTP